MDIANMTDNTLKSQAFKLKGRLYTLTAMHILSTDFTIFKQQLADTIVQAPRLFENTPIVLDCSAIDGNELDLQSFCNHMREQGLVPVALQGGTPLLETLAQCQGLAKVSASDSHSKSRKTKVEDSQPDEKKDKATLSRTSKLVTMPIRSGQQVVSKGGDLVITASVSHGAELLADGHIHVYGALRGRALAGIAGDRTARIFCQSLEAELVSIAGFYKLRDSLTQHTGPCQIFLQDDHIQIEAL